MTTGRWLAILVGTLVSALAMWFGFVAIATAPFVGLAIVGVGLAFAMYAMAGFSGVEDVGKVGFRASLAGILTALALLVTYEATDVSAFAVAAPVLAIGVGGAYALAPTGDKLRTWIRIAAVVGVAIAMNWLYEGDHTIYGIVAPLLPLPAIGIVDKVYDRGVEVVAEDDPG